MKGREEKKKDPLKVLLSCELPVRLVPQQQGMGGRVDSEMR